MGTAFNLDSGVLLKSFVKDIPNFPIEGIVFKDITPLLADSEAFSQAIEQAVAYWQAVPIDLVVAVESRGFILGAPLAYALSAGLVLVRKPGKLPGAKDRFDYTCEYCSGTLEVHKGSIGRGKRCLFVDDLLATGGTAYATANYIQSMGGELAGFGFLVEISSLNGRAALSRGPIHSVLSY